MIDFCFFFFAMAAVQHSHSVPSCMCWIQTPPPSAHLHPKAASIVSPSPPHNQKTQHARALHEPKPTSTRYCLNCISTYHVLFALARLRMLRLALACLRVLRSSAQTVQNRKLGLLWVL